MRRINLIGLIRDIISFIWFIISLIMEKYVPKHIKKKIWFRFLVISLFTVIIYFVVDYIYVLRNHTIALYYKKKENYEMAKEYYYKNAIRGDIYDQVNVGNMYSELGQNEEAKYWYKKAAEKEVPEAYFNLGLEFEEENNLTEAKYWCKKAADKKLLSGMNCLGNIYRKEKDLVEAKKWAKMAADKGDFHSQALLGFIFFDQKNYEESLFWFFKALENKKCDSCYGMISHTYYWQEKYKESKIWAEKGVAVNDSFSIVVMGDLLIKENKYSNAEDWHKDAVKYSEAVKWYEKAADQGDINAQDRLNKLAQFKESKK